MLGLWRLRSCSTGPASVRIISHGLLCDHIIDAVFHDVDLLPEDDRNLYTCADQPRHMSVAVDKLKYRLPYPELFGGVSALSKDVMEKVNGFSNQFWGEF